METRNAHEGQNHARNRGNNQTMNQPPITDRVSLLEEEVVTLQAEVARLARRANFPQYLKPEELAEMLQVSVGTIHNMVSAKTIPFHKVGGSTRFLLSEIVEWTGGKGGLRLAKSA